MRTDARFAAAIEILDTILAGEPAERCLTNWARGNRFAGSGDRAAIRDLVFDALRRKRSLPWLGGAVTGRGLMLGLARLKNLPPDSVFTGEGYGPARLTPAEMTAGEPMGTAEDAVRLDCPDWLWPQFSARYGADAAAILEALQSRADVHLRVNRARSTVTGAIDALREDGIEAVPHDMAATALRITDNPRRVNGSRAYREGLVELQDAASQAVVEACISELGTGRALDYCAGGGGKSLAFAAAGMDEVTAHDAVWDRMRDLPARAKRAGTPIRTVRMVTGSFDLVLCDAPCSGSGAWRRQPQAKWTLDQTGLSDLTKLQDGILTAASVHVAADGVLAYATCSLLRQENEARVDAFLSQHHGWRCIAHQQWTPLDGGDGFFLALFRRD